MSPRTGVPPKENPRNTNLNIRVTKDEAQLIQECADALGITRTDAIIKGITLVKAVIDKTKRLTAPTTVRQSPIVPGGFPLDKSILSQIEASIK